MTEGEKQRRKAERKLQTKKTVKEATSGIKTTIVNKARTPMNMDTGRLRKLYQDVFTRNAKMDDTEITDVLIENRTRLRHRFQASIIVTGLPKDEKNTRECGRLNLIGILAEEAQDVSNWLKPGQEVEYLSQFLGEILNYYETNYGIAGGSVSTQAEHIKVASVEMEFSFA